MNLYGTFALVLVLSMGIASGSSAGASGHGKRATMDSLDGKSFRSARIEGYEIGRRKVTISFTTGPLPKEKGQEEQVDGPLMLASAGCNGMGGEYRVRKGLVRWVGSSYSTGMMCFPYHDGWLSGLLQKGVRARIAGRQLTLTRGKKQKIVLRQTKS